MSMSAPIALIGASGGVGQSALQHLRNWGIGPVKLGMRNISKLAQATESRSQINCDDEESIEQFIEGARLVVNCAGPFGSLGNKVAEVAVACGLDLVDVNGTEENVSDLRTKIKDSSRVVLGCGMMPGLSGALPLWAARQVREPIVSMRILSGGRDYLTPAGAADIIYAARRRANKVRLDDRVRGTNLIPSKFTMPQNITELFFEEAIAVAYEDEEHRVLKEKMKLSHIEALAIFPGQATHTLLRNALSQDTDLSVLAERIAKVSKADVAGYQRYQQLVVELFSGANSHEPEFRINLRASGASELTGAVVAVVVFGILHKHTIPGIQLCSDAFAADWAVNKLQSTAALIYLDCQKRDSVFANMVEEGTL